MTSAGSAAWVLVGALLAAACRPAEGPRPIVYDGEACAHCRMLISEPRFAAQLVGKDGSVASFDDPGCLLAYQEDRAEAAADLWFHHLREDRWLSGEQVAFEAIDETPMGYGLGAVDAGSAGALSLSAARERVAARRARSASGGAP